MPVKAGQLTKRQAQYLDALDECQGSVPEVAKVFGVTESTVYACLARDHVKDELVKRIRRALSMGAVRASYNLIKLSSHAKSEFVQLEASKAILDRSGVTESGDTSGVLAIQINLNADT